MTSSPTLSKRLPAFPLAGRCFSWCEMLPFVPRKNWRPRRVRGSCSPRASCGLPAGPVTARWLGCIPACFKPTAAGRPGNQGGRGGGEGQLHKKAGGLGATGWLREEVGGFPPTEAHIAGRGGAGQTPGESPLHYRSGQIFAPQIWGLTSLHQLWTGSRQFSLRTIPRPLLPGFQTRVCGAPRPAPRPAPAVSTACICAAFRSEVISFSLRSAGSPFPALSSLRAFSSLRMTF